MRNLFYKRIFANFPRKEFTKKDEVLMEKLFYADYSGNIDGVKRIGLGMSPCPQDRMHIQCEYMTITGDF